MGTKAEEIKDLIMKDTMNATCAAILYGKGAGMSPDDILNCIIDSMFEIATMQILTSHLSKNFAPPTPDDWEGWLGLCKVRLEAAFNNQKIHVSKMKHTGMLDMLKTIGMTARHGGNHGNV